MIKAEVVNQHIVGGLRPRDRSIEKVKTSRIPVGMTRSSIARLDNRVGVALAIVDIPSGTVTKPIITVIFLLPLVHWFTPVLTTV